MPSYSQMTMFKALGAFQKVLLQTYVKFENLKIELTLIKCNLYNTHFVSFMFSIYNGKTIQFIRKYFIL